MDAPEKFGETTNDAQESSAEDWQARVALLEGIVCLLLAKNQSMRMALSVERGTERFRAAL